jgi:cell division septation protein DedD
MSDPGFREIHLSGKHVVFLFMAVVVAGVGVFLLGVSVGKGVSKPDAVSAQGLPPAVSSAADTGTSPSPDSTKPKPGELDYFKTMGKAAPAVSPSPSASPDAPAATPEPKASATPKASASPTPTPTPTSTPDKPTVSPAPAAATGSWYVVVDSFSSRANATSQTNELKKKGYTATVFNSGKGGTPYKTRLGPFPDRQAAESMKARLNKEGYKSLVTR